MNSQLQAGAAHLDPRLRELVNPYDEEIAELLRKKKDLEKEHDRVGVETMQEIADIDTWHEEKKRPLEDEHEALMQRITELNESLQLELRKLDINNGKRDDEDRDHKAKLQRAHAAEAKRTQKISSSIAATNSYIRHKRIAKNGLVRSLQQQLENQMESLSADGDDPDEQTSTAETQQPGPAMNRVLTPPRLQGKDGTSGPHPRVNHDEGELMRGGQDEKTTAPRLNGQNAPEMGIQQPAPPSLGPTPLASRADWSPRNTTGPLNARGDAPSTSSTEGSSARIPFKGVSNPALSKLYRGYSSKSRSWHAVLVLNWRVARDMTVLGTTPWPKCVVNFRSWRSGYQDGGPLVEDRQFPVLCLSGRVTIPTSRGEQFRMPEQPEHFEWIPARNLMVLDPNSPEQATDVGRAEAMALPWFWPISSQSAERDERVPTQPTPVEATPSSVPRTERLEHGLRTPISPLCARREISRPLCLRTYAPPGETAAGPAEPGVPERVPFPSLSAAPHSDRTNRSCSPSSIVVVPLKLPGARTPSMDGSWRGSQSTSRNISNSPPATRTRGKTGSLGKKKLCAGRKRARDESETDGAAASSSPSKRPKSEGGGATKLVEYEHVYCNGSTRHRIHLALDKSTSEDWYIFSCEFHSLAFQEQNVLEELQSHAREHGLKLSSDVPAALWADCVQHFGVIVRGCDAVRAERNNCALECSRGLRSGDKSKDGAHILPHIQKIPLGDRGVSEGDHGVSENNPIVLD